MSELVELKCSNCGSPLDPADISPQIAAARCRHCNSLFAIPATTAKSIPRGEVELPKYMEITNDAGDLLITRRWFTHTVWFLVFFCVFWNGFLVVWHTIALTQGQWFMSAFALLHTAVGIGLLYFVLATFLNRTVIRAGHGALEVTHGPIPWRGNQRLDATRLTQLFVREKITHGKNGARTTYEVEAIFTENHRRTLLKSLSSADQAIFIEQQLEKHLNITDQRVEGEYRG